LIQQKKELFSGLKTRHTHNTQLSEGIFKKKVATFCPIKIGEISFQDFHTFQSMRKLQRF